MSSSPTPPPTRRRFAVPRPVVAGTLATLAIGGLLAAPRALASTAHHPDSGARNVVQQQLDRLVDHDHFPGALASVRSVDGRVRNYTAGVGDLKTGAKVPVNGEVRIGSNTKTFTAVVVLQLVGEGRISLDAPVEKYLPGVVHGNGNDGRRVTVHQLLQQMSGIPDYDDVLFTKAQDEITLRHNYLQPRSLVDAALTRPPDFAPGTKWEYSNTNYILAGLIAEHVTGRPIGEEITNRVIRPLHLRHTYWPTQGDQRIVGRHPHGYVGLAPGAPWVDVTELDPSMGWSAGQLISTPNDLRTFLAAVVRGDLLKPAQHRAMLTTVAAPGFEPAGTWRYGLGIAEHPLPCGGVAWGHGGDIQGFETRDLVTTDGRSAVVTVTGLPTSEQMVNDVDDSVDAVLCP